MGEIYLDPKPGKIHGFIKVNTTEDPIENATLIVTGNSTLSGSNGEFIVDAEVGNQNLMIYHPDYETKIIEVLVEKNSIKEIGTIYLLPRPGTVIGSTVPAEATINFYGNYQNYTINSDSDGDFIIDDIAADSYLMEINAENYYTKARKNIIVNSGGTTDVGIIVLDPEVGDVTGRVTREDGVGIENAQVESSVSVLTDANGEFRLSGLIGGMHTLTINAGGFETKNITEVVVNPNQTSDIGDIALEALESGLGDLEVEAFNMAGEPVEASITLIDRNETIITDSSNGYKALWEGIPRGPYTIKAENEDYYSYIKDAIVVSDRKTIINFNLIDKSIIVDNLGEKIDELQQRSAYWDKEIGYPVEERYTLAEDVTPMDYKINYSGPEDIYVGSSIEDPNGFYDLVDENYNELFDKNGAPVKIIDLLDENGDQLPHTDGEGNDIRWYGKETGEEVHLVLSATPTLPEGLTDIVVMYAVRKTMKDLAVDALIKRGVTAKEVDVSVVDTISQLKGLGYKWNEPVPEDSTLVGLKTRIDGNEETLNSHQTSISQNAEQIGLNAGRLTTNEENIEANEGAITVNADNISSVVSRMDTAEGEIDLAQSEINQNADSITSTVRHINIDEGSYLYFDGIDDFLDLGTLNISSDILSIKTEVLFKNFEGHQAIFCAGDTARGIELALYNNDLHLGIEAAEGHFYIGYDIQNLKEDKWYQIEAVADGPAGKLILKIDGSPANTKEVGSFTGFFDNQESFLGTTKYDSPASGISSEDMENFFNGFINRLQLWHSYQNEGEITEVEGSEAGLINAWEINEGAGSTTADIKELNPGTIEGCSWYGIEATTSQVKQLSNQYTVKVQEHVNGKDIISGFGLASKDGQSEFSIMADRFYIFGDLEDGSEIGTPVFAIDGQTGSIYIEANLIANGSITAEKMAAASVITNAAQIENALINTAHIDYLDVDSIDIRGRLTAEHIIVGENTEYQNGYNPKTINDKLTEDISDLNKSFSSLGNQLSQFTDDLKLTHIESETLRGSKTRVKTEWSSLNSVANSIISTSIYDVTNLEAKRAEAENAVEELELELNNWIGLSSYPVTISESDKTNIETKFDNVMQKKAELLNEITKFRQEAAIAWASTEIETMETELQNQINSFSEDGKITKAEANTLETTLENLKKESEDLIFVAENVGLVTITESYQSSLLDLENELNHWIGFNDEDYPLDISATSTTRALVRNKFDEVETKKTQLYNAITDKKTEEAKLYSEADIIADNLINIFHFDGHLTSTKGITPYGNYKVSFDEGRFDSGVIIKSLEEGELRYDLSEFGLTPEKGTISLILKIPEDEIINSGSGYKRIFSIGQNTEDGQFMAYYNSSDSTFRFRIYNNLTAQEVYKTHTYGPGWKRFTFKWDENEMAMFIGNEKIIKNNFSLPLTFVENYIFIGSKNSSEQHIDTVIDELLIAPFNEVDSKIKNWSEMEKPFMDLNSKIIAKKPESVLMTEVD